MKKIETTLLLIRKNGKILLARKRRGFGEGKFNGVGGKREPNETIDETMLRETKEEIGVTPKNWQKIAYIEYDEVMKGERSLVCMSLYTATDFDGTPEETEEMSPAWFDENNLPFGEMFGDDPYWFPYLLAGQKFKAKFVFDDDFNITSYNITPVDDLD